MRTPPPKDSKQHNKKKAQIENIAIDQNITIEEIQKNFPTIYSELADQKMSMNITNVEEQKDDERINQDPFHNYDPDVYDFLARAKTDEEGLEIIDYLFKQGQISSETQTELVRKVKKLGIRSFGPLRSPNYYFKRSDEIRKQRPVQQGKSG